MRTVLGIDPGARATGLCVLSGDQIVAHRTITSEGEIFPAERRYVLAVLEAGATLRQIHDVDLVAVETITRPSWHMKGRAAVDPTALLATAEVLGAVLGVTGPSTSPKSDPTKTGHNHSAPTPRTRLTRRTTQSWMGKPNRRRPTQTRTVRLRRRTTRNQTRPQNRTCTGELMSTIELEPDTLWRNKCGVEMHVIMPAYETMQTLGEIWIARPKNALHSERWLVTAEGMADAGYVRVSA